MTQTVMEVGAGEQLLEGIEIEGLCDVGGKETQAYKLTQQVFDFVLSCPMEQVEFRLHKDGKVPAELVADAILEFRKFVLVVLAAKPEEKPIGMISPIVDEAWHALILHTRDYREFCDEIGMFLDHFPVGPRTAANPQSVTNFLTVYRRVFGELPEIWTMGRKNVVLAADCTPSTNCQDDEACASQKP